MTSRSSTFCSSRGSKKPQIQHPLFRFSVDGNLHIRGQHSDSGTNVPNDEVNSFKPTSIKDCDLNNNTSSGHILQWPPEFMKDSCPPKRTKKKERIGNKQILGYHEELDYQIREKLTCGFYGVRHLFRANDSYGHGIVSREALRHILFAMVGYIEGYQFTKFLKRHGLDNKPTVSFDTFVACFQEGENGKKEWMRPYQKASVEKKSYPEEHLRNNDFWLRDSSLQTGTFCFSLFKQKAKEKDFNMGSYLPSACFKREGKIVPPQLREAMATLGLRMSNEEFHKVWDRFDWEGIGAIKTKHLLKILGLGPDGKQVQKIQSAKVKERVRDTKSSPVQLQVTNSAIWREQQAEKTQEQADVKGGKSSTEQEDIELKRKKSETKLKQVKSCPSAKIQIRVESISDCLTARFEESSNSLLTAFQLFDHGNNGLVSKVDFLRVLLEFGFNLPPEELDVFMMRCSLRLTKGEINYNDFLNRYQSRGDGSLTHRIITSNRFHYCSNQESLSTQPLSAEDLEVQLVLFLHGEFMRFVRMLKKYDVHDVGVITQLELSDVLEKFLGYHLSQKQFSRLVNDIGQEKEGLIPYYKLLQIFTTNPKEWNKKLDLGRSTPHGDPSQHLLVPDRESPKTTGKSGIDSKQLRESMASTKELEMKVRDMLKRKFHTFDKNFKHMDKRKTSRLNRIQFRELLKLCGLELQTEELLLVWSNMGVRHDGVIGYIQLLAHFIKQPQNTMPEGTRDSRKTVKKAKTFVQERTETKVKIEAIKTATQKTVNRQIVETILDKEPSPEKRFVDEALKKIHDQVISNWDTLKQKFRQLDGNGFANIPVAEMKILLTKFTNNLTSEEIIGILQRYDMKKNGRFSYMNFMRQYQHNLMFSEERSSGNRAARPQTAPAAAYREPLGKCLQQFQQQVLAKWKNVRQAFKALDMNCDGYVSPYELRQVLKQFGIRETEVNLYHLMSEFDTNMDGKISYKEFLEQCLPL